MGWAACRVAVSAIVDAILQFGCIWRIPLLYAFVDVLPRKGQWDFLGRARALTRTLESMEDAFGAFACIFFANALLFASKTPATTALAAIE